MTTNLPRQDGEFSLPNELAAELIGTTTTTLWQWGKQVDPPPRNDDGTYPAKALGQWMRQKQIMRRNAKSGNYPYMPDGVVIRHKGLPSGVPTKTMDTERMRKESAQADKVEMENELQRGNLVKASDVEQAWSDILSRVKMRMMQVPYVSAMLVVGDDDMPSVQEKIKSAVKDALTEMSADWQAAADEDKDD